MFISKSNAAGRSPSGRTQGAPVLRADDGLAVQGRRVAHAQQEGADGPAAFSTAANKRRSITVRIKKSAYRRLNRVKRIRTTITLVSRGSDGVLRKKSQRVTMTKKAAKKAKKKQR